MAEEVRNLAIRSATAAKSTTDVIERSVQMAEDGVEMNKLAAASFEAIGSQVDGIVEVLVAIAQGSSDQSRAVEQVHSVIDGLSRDTQSNAASTNQTASSAQELEHQAGHLRELASEFKTVKAQLRGVANVPRLPPARSGPESKDHGG